MPRPAKRRRVRHAQVAARLRARPRVWHEVSVHEAGYSARRLARAIHTAYRLPHYEPAGSFEAQVIPREEDAIVVARWLGAQANATPA